MTRPPKKKQNPIHASISSWLDTLPLPFLESLANQLNADAANAKQLLVDRAPKRWVVYEPMVLLPSGSFTAAPWPALLKSVAPPQKEALWTAILHHLSPSNSKPPLTHLAINEGIPLHLSHRNNSATTPSQSTGEPGRQQQPSEEEENLLRAPAALHPLHGSFGPAPSTSTSSSRPTQADFRSALWVSTTQNGIVQTWAPRHTMFSRGNIKEKARLLSFHSPSSSSSSNSRHTARVRKKETLRGRWAVDLYAGIGYFAFSYARLGMQVLCWELNAWSVEGLRRGAEANGFSVRVVTPPSAGEGGGNEVDLAEVLGLGNEEGDRSQIVVFLEDNRRAAGRVREARERIGAEQLEVVHVNCGFLPSSEGVWRDAWEIVQTGSGGDVWLHLHENVGVGDIEGRKEQVQALFDRWKRERGDGGPKEAKVEHVELVKTYAPGVWHCVFDVFITRDSV
ncbi:S-adenosyl-L-methionine-dependent methyltransferase [Achaetomium macrosporum]|uniref:tRNA wybutosine-synthesizing protein 2 n=1 Tax=Achaetomium macrosporum TaxID=79813 RepID=A0AAN7C8I5_9PEZI|nr:S-adenosyl-L-methionine-dependent methyltransferase [Achaetomium macrosporum]